MFWKNSNVSRFFKSPTCWLRKASLPRVRQSVFLSSPPVANTQRPASRGSSSGLGTNPLALRKKWSGGDSRGRAFSEERFPPPAPHPSRFLADGEGIPAEVPFGREGNWQRGCCFFVDNAVDYCLWKSILPAMIPPAPRSRRHGSGCPDCGTKRDRLCAASGPVPRGCRARWARRPRCRRS